MKTKKFGIHKEQTRDYEAELFDLVGVAFPIALTVRDNKLIGFSYEQEWKEGGTEPVQVKATKKKPARIEYKEKYTEKSLTKDQIAKIEKWVKDNLVS